MKKSIIMLASTTGLLLASSARAEQIAPNENIDIISQPTDDAQGSHFNLNRELVALLNDSSVCHQLQKYYSQ